MNVVTILPMDVNGVRRYLTVCPPGYREIVSHRSNDRRIRQWFPARCRAQVPDHGRPPQARSRVGSVEIPTPVLLFPPFAEIGAYGIVDVSPAMVPDGKPAFTGPLAGEYDELF